MFSDTRGAEVEFMGKFVTLSVVSSSNTALIWVCPELTAIEGTGEDCAYAKKATMMIKQSEIDKK